MAIGKVIGRVAVKVLPDTTDFREKTADDLRRIEKQLGDVEVDVVPELDKSAKNRVKAELKSLSEGLRAKVRVDLDLNNADVAKTTAAIEALSKRRRVRIAPDLDQGAAAKVAAGLAALSGVRYVQGLFRKFREELMRIDLAVPKIGVVSHAVAVLGAWIMGVSGNLFSLSSSIASIGKAGLALPGIFGGIAIGLATTVAALMDFNTHVPQATRYVRELQDTISQNFWEMAAAPIRDLVDKLFPILNRKLAETSTAIGGFFAAFANSTVEILLPSLPPMFDHLTKSIQIATGFTDAFVGIIEKLGKVGSSYLPRLAQWFGDIATQFDNWLGRVGTDGLKAMIDEGIEALKDLGSVTASTFSIFASLGRAAEAAGGTTLSSLADSMRAVADAAKSPGFQSGLTNTLSAAYGMLAKIREIAGPALKGLVVSMSENFQSLAPIIGDTVGTALEALASALSNPAVGEGLTAMFQGFNDMVHTLAPTMDLVAEKFAVMGKLIGSLARNIGVVMAAAIVTLKPLFISLVDALLPVINMLGPLMAGVITALKPVFATLGQALGRAATAMGPLFAAVQRLVSLLMPVLVPVLKVIASIIGDALVAVVKGLTWVFEGLVKIVSGVIDVFSGLWDILAGIFTLDFSRIGEGIKKVFSGLGQIILGVLQGALGAVWAYLNGTVLGFFKKFAMKLLGPIAGPLGSFFQPIVSAAQKAWGVLKKVFGYITEGIKYIFGGKSGSFGSRVKEVLVYPFENAVGAIRGVFNIIKTIVSTAWSVIKTIFTAAFTVIKTVISTYVAVWSTIFRAAWNVIKTVFTAAWSAIRTIVTVAFEGIRAFFSGAMDGLYWAFKGPWDAIAEFLSITMGTIRASITLVWNGIKGFFLGVLDWFIIRFQITWAAVKSAVTTSVNATKSVVTTVWNAIKSAVSSVLKSIETVFKTVWKAIESVVKTAVDAVSKVISTTWNAIKSTTSTVFNAVKSVLSNVWSSIKGTVSSAANSVRSTVSGAWNSVKSATTSAWNSVKSTVSDAWGKVKSSVVTGVKNVVTEVKKLPGKATTALASIGTVLVNAGRSLIQGFINGIGEKFKDVKNKLGELTGKLTSWKGPESLDKVLLTPVGRLIIDGLIKGFEDRFTAVRNMLKTLTQEIAGFIGKSMSQEISDALSFAVNGEVGTSINAGVTGVNLDRRLGGLERHVTTTARAASKEKPAPATSSVQIGNITIPLEDLAQLKDLEEFLDLLRVRIRQG